MSLKPRLPCKVQGDFENKSPLVLDWENTSSLGLALSHCFPCSLTFEKHLTVYSEDVFLTTRVTFNKHRSTSPDWTFNGTLITYQFSGTVIWGRSASPRGILIRLGYSHITQTYLPVVWLGFYWIAWACVIDTLYFLPQRYVRNRKLSQQTQQKGRRYLGTFWIRRQVSCMILTLFTWKSVWIHYAPGSPGLDHKSCVQLQMPSREERFGRTAKKVSCWLWNHRNGMKNLKTRHKERFDCEIEFSQTEHNGGHPRLQAILWWWAPLSCFFFFFKIEATLTFWFLIHLSSEKTCRFLGALSCVLRGVSGELMRGCRARRSGHYRCPVKCWVAQGVDGCASNHRCRRRARPQLQHLILSVSRPIELILPGQNHPRYLVSAKKFNKTVSWHSACDTCLGRWDDSWPNLQGGKHAWARLFFMSNAFRLFERTLTVSRKIKPSLPISPDPRARIQLVWRRDGCVWTRILMRDDWGVVIAASRDPSRRRSRADPET